MSVFRINSKLVNFLNISIKSSSVTVKFSKMLMMTRLLKFQKLLSDLNLINTILFLYLRFKIKNKIRFFINFYTIKIVKEILLETTYFDRKNEFIYW